MRSTAVLGLVALAACGHSEPFAGYVRDLDGPFSPARPIRLTYAPFTDAEPNFSQDGQWITYVYEREDNRRDRCIAVLPVGGGTRTQEICPRNDDPIHWALGYTSPALRADGTLLLARHFGIVGNMTSLEQELFVAPVDSGAGVRTVHPLGVGRPGDSQTWGGLVDPVWLADGRLMALAARRQLVSISNCKFGSPFTSGCPYDQDRTAITDTLLIGFTIVEVSIQDGMADVRDVAPADDVISWSLDTSTDIVHVVVQRARTFDETDYHESIADTVYATPVTGGSRNLLYGVDSSSPLPHTRIHGVASGGGRVFISRSYRGEDQRSVPVITRGTDLGSDISEILPDGSLRTIAPAISWRWGGIRLSPDGRHLVAEAVERTTSDIYLLELPQ